MTDFKLSKDEFEAIHYAYRKLSAPINNGKPAYYDGKNAEQLKQIIDRVVLSSPHIQRYTTPCNNNNEQDS